MSDYSLLIKSMPIFSVFFVVLSLASAGLPGTSGFIGELLVVMGVFKNYLFFGILISSGIILGAVYMMSLVRKVIFTGEKEINVTKISELNIMELTLMFFLVFVTLFLGFYPNIILDIIDLSTNKLLTNFK